jgi:hypothetical protein
MDLTRWLTTWLSRHPLKEPTAVDRAQDTAEVMQRVRALADPTPEPAAPRGAWLWVRFGLVAAGVAAVLDIVGVVQPRRAQLAAVGESVEFERTPPTEAPQTARPLELAESLPTDETWVDQTLELLDQLDESAPEDDNGSVSTDEDWLKELELLDETDLASRS